MVVVVLLAALLVLVVVAKASGRSGERRSSVRPPSLDRDARERARQRRLPPRPAADQPPAGLSPLVASRRVVAQEAERGIRELEHWLAERPAA